MSPVPQAISFRPIAFIFNDIASPEGVRWDGVVSRIVLEPALLPALEGIAGFSHLIVLFYCHLQPRESPSLRLHPEGRSDMPLVGLFATRSPRRPNPIGMTVVELLRQEGNVLEVRGLDALDGTPVLDLKPYLPRGDRLSRARVPDWIERLWAMHDEERNDG